ncbi:MAG TPA: DUF2231 domain-containing protein [Gemmatimonadaceae bacterium]|nr:DUF2231 domain-containing protein [Gemmatimonadaceae bacterium]
MRSRASLKGHPMHPALIPFPFAFLTGALLFDLAGRLFARPAWWETGAHLSAAGVVTALVAAVPGFIDYRYTVPPRSTGKRRATKHLAANLSAVALFAAGWLVRGDASSEPSWLLLLLEAAGAGLLAIGGWMGGTLAYRNQIGVDHRYAEAGKWREARVDAGKGEAVAAASGELGIDQMKLVHVNGKRIVLARTGEGYVAFDDRCPHRGGSLAGGTMICGTVQCPWHGSQFDAGSGQVRAGPAKAAISTYDVEVRGGEIRVRTTSASRAGAKTTD